MKKKLNDAYARVTTIHEFTVQAERGIKANMRAFQKVTGTRPQENSYIVATGIRAYTGMLGGVENFNWDNGNPTGMNDEELNHAAIDMNMYPDDGRAMVGNTEQNNSTGVDDDLDIIAMFSTADHKLAQVVGRSSGRNMPLQRH